MKKLVIVGIIVVFAGMFVLILMAYKTNKLSRNTPTVSIPLNSTSSETTTQEDNSSTSTFSNFSFKYPKDGSIITLESEGVSYPGNLVIALPEDSSVSIFTTNAPYSSINSSAAILDDYEGNYSAGAYEVVIASNTNMTNNGVPMLRQVYSLGMIKDSNGHEIFTDTDEGEIPSKTRYVFFDGKKFIVITAIGSDRYLESIVKSIQLLPTKN